MKKIENYLDLLYHAYQPIVDLKTGKIFGYEAFLRGYQYLNYKTPIELFDSAFRNNYLFTLDINLRKKAINRIWKKINNEKVKLFYNYDPRVIEIDCYSKNRIDEVFSNICFDIEFNSSVDETDVFYLVSFYKKLGASFSFNNLCNKKEFFILLKNNYLKINKKTIVEAINNNLKKIELKKILDFAKEANLKTIATFIESEEDIYMCKEYNINYIQGYFVGKPQVDVV